MVNDYIVTRLRGSWDCSCLYIKENGLDRKCLHCEAADEIERLRGLLLIFDTHFVCDECEKACATYLQGCENPLHALHTASWELF